MDAQIKLLIQKVQLHCYARIKDELETARKSPYDDDYTEVIEYPYNVMDASNVEEEQCEDVAPLSATSNEEKNVAGGSPLTDFEEPEKKSVQISIDEAIGVVEKKLACTEPCRDIDSPAQKQSLKEQYKYERKLANLRINKITQRSHDRVAGYQSVLKYLDELIEKYEAESMSYDV